MSSDDSSDNDDLEQLREAQDTQFLNEKLYNKEKGNISIEPEKKLPSLRISADENDQFNSIKVTPEFRKYVAKQLSLILDRKLENEIDFALRDKQIKKKRKNGGIKLFSNSQKLLKIEKNFEKTGLITVKSKPNLIPSQGVSITNEDLKSLAVSGEDIFSKKDTIHWSNRSKSKLFTYKKSENGSLELLNVPNIPTDLPPAPSNPKKRRKNAQIQPPPSVQDLLPPPLSGYGDTIVASNPFDDCPSNVNTGMTIGRPHGGPPMGMGGPNMVMAGNMGMYRPMCPNPSMGMNSPMMHSHSPNAHQMNNPMMMNGPRMNHMGPGPGHGPPHMMPSPNGPGGGGPMGPNMSMTGPPIHSPIGMSMSGQGPGNSSPMGHGGPLNGGGMNNPMNGPPMGSPQMSHGPHGPHGPHGGSGPNPGMNMSPGNVPPVGPPMNNNFIMSPMNNMYSKPMPVSAGKVYPVDQPMVFNSQNPNAPPIYPCGVCHKEVHDNDQAILCESGCNFWFHRGCTGLTEAAFQLLTAEVYAEWVCDKCLHSKNIPLVKFKP